MNLLLSMSLIGIDEYAQEYNYLEDQQVNDCLIHMYFYMMCNDRDNKEDMYQEFDKRYNELNNEQQELVKKDYLNIIDAQDNKGKTN